MVPRVVIVGRPNVGKSTLFNRLVGRRQAIVDATPGVTRDRRIGKARLGHLSFSVVDTAGLEDAEPETLEAAMHAQTERAVSDADVVLFLIDARAGLTPLDEHFARRLRRSHKPVVLVANKCEGAKGAAGALEAHALGLGDPVTISAEHGEGMVDLLDALLAHFGSAAAVDEAEPDDDVEGARAEGPIALAVVGRPNVGKSTLINRLLGEERVLVGPEPGVTRDAIAVEWDWQGHAIRLIDTAGLRRRARVTHNLEKLAAHDTLDAIRFAHVVVVAIDATQPLEHQDLTIASHVVEEGRALVIAANKWDLIDDPGPRLRELRARLDESLAQVPGVTIVPLSAQTGRGLERLMPAVLATYAIWNRRIATAELNRWLEGATDRHPPPIAKGRRIRLRYIAQVNARPPTFALFASQPSAVPGSYLRYLEHGLRDAFEMPGVPIRFTLRERRNPYVTEGARR